VEFRAAFDPAREDVLVRRQSGGRLELPREVVDAEVGGRGQLPEIKPASRYPSTYSTTASAIAGRPMLA
jgi:hypothetical protein